jgi:predicted Zn-dependent protease
LAKSDGFQLGGVGEVIASPQAIFAIAACLFFSFTIYQPNKLLPELDQANGKKSFVDTEAILQEAASLEPAKLAAEGKVDLAITKAHQMANAKPLDVLSNVCAGNVIAQVGDKDQGVRLLKKAAALAPRSRWVRINLADTLAASKRYTEAIDQYKLILQVYPHWARPHLSLANIYWQQDDEKKVAEELGLALESDSGNTDARKMRGFALARAGQSKKGFDEFMIAEAQEHTVSGPPADIKHQIENWKTPERAIYELHHQLDQNPDDPMNKLRLARLLIYTNELAEAKQLLLEARRAAPTNYEIHRNLAYVLQKLGDSNLALHEFIQSVKQQEMAEKRGLTDK